MANHSCGRRRSPPPAVPAVYPEPEVRRWPHPTHAAPEPENLSAALHYLCCSLSYQNQLLSEIRSLLEGLSPGSGKRQE